MASPSAAESSPSAHVDTFARDHLPPPDLWPDLVFDLPTLRYPPRLNCAAELLDRHVVAGCGEHTAVLGDTLGAAAQRLFLAPLEAQHPS